MVVFSVEELQQIDGIGPVLADRIVAARPFTRIEDLMQVDGIGIGLLERAGKYLTVVPSPRSK